MDFCPTSYNKLLYEVPGYFSYYIKLHLILAYSNHFPHRTTPNIYFQTTNISFHTNLLDSIK